MATAGRWHPRDVIENADLLAACRAGDRSAWVELVSRFERLVYAIPIREGLDPHRAEEVTQETFLALVRALDRIDRPDRLGYWLMTVARRLTWRALGDPRGEVDEPGEVADEASVFDDRIHTAVWVHEAIQGLGPACRDLIISLFFDPTEPSYVEIAQRLGLPIGSIGPSRKRCLDKLRIALEESM